MIYKNSSLLRYVFILLISLLSHTGTAYGADDSWVKIFKQQSELAKKGKVKAQYIIGEMYELGRGTEKDLDSALLWYKKADDNGHHKAAYRIERINQRNKLEALKKTQAEAEVKRREQEQTRQLVLQKQKLRAEKIKQQAEEKARLEKQSRKKEIAAKLSSEERAKQIKLSQERARAIAKQNEMRQQQAADAELNRYRNSLNPPAKDQKPDNSSQKYQDPFE